MQTLAQLRSGALAGATRLDLPSCGLGEFPREIFDLADTLEILNLNGNALRDLPDDLGRLHRLRILFGSENAFEHLPPSLGGCPRLEMVGFRNNRIASLPAEALPPLLRWLILTGNRLRALPDAIGGCNLLQKLMLSGNRLAVLPEELAQCERLELLRIAANELPALPPWLLQMPRLAWLAFAGNPCAPLPKFPPQFLPEIDWSALVLEDKLGEGASGSIHRAFWHAGAEDEAESVAVKMFKDTMTSDGLPECELAACLAAGNHANLIPLRGRLVNHPQGAQGLVMDLLRPGSRTLAGPPSFESCTRDVYPEGLRLEPEMALAIARGAASAAAHLHARGIHHGDLYAHNLHWHKNGDTLLGDFGAASFYAREDDTLASALEGIEARAFGCLLEELITHSEWITEHAAQCDVLEGLCRQCLLPDPRQRPRFIELAAALGGDRG